MKANLGLTLMFFSHREKSAVKASFITSEILFEAVIHAADKIGQTHVEKFLPGFEYVGISDMYISETLEEGNYLGRTSYFDIKSLDEALDLVTDQEELTQSYFEANDFKSLNVSFVYFHEDKEGKEYNSAMVIYSNFKKKKSLIDIANFADSKEFKSKILRYSIEELHLEGLKFLGFCDLYGVLGNGLFQEEKHVKDVSELKSELLNEMQIKHSIEELKEDMAYVYSQ